MEGKGISGRNSLTDWIGGRLFMLANFLYRTIGREKMLLNEAALGDLKFALVS